MSYILEALKKAQAERQLGSAPTIHAPAAAPATPSQAARSPLVAGVAVGALLVAGGLYYWHRQPAPATEAATAASAAPVAPAASTVAVVKPAAPHVALVGEADPPAKPVQPVAPVARSSEAPAAAVVNNSIPAAAPVAARTAMPKSPVPVTAAAPATPPVARAQAPARVAQAGAASTVPAASPAPAQQLAMVAPPVSGDETLGGMNTLPESVRAGIPKVAFGGYMYSPNPADRLILVDNILRREGEEVAAGLVLERLLPKGAVMNYRGYRYRVPF